VSTIDQNLALQRDALAEAGCGKIFTEQLSGAVTDRPALHEALAFARSGDTLTGLKRLIEMVADGDGKLCVLLAGHPKLRRDLRNPTMEEIGYRTAVFSLEGVTGSQREYIEWMLATCAADKTKVDAILDPAAVDLLASRLRTPLQIEQHLTLALETGYQASEKPVGEAIVDSVLSKQIDDLEPTLTRHGYTAKVLTEMLGTKPGEIKALFKQTLEVDRARELKEQMLAAGLPL
jgi:hypothetical protein